MLWLKAFAVAAGVAALAQAQTQTESKSPATGALTSVFASGLASSLLHADTAPVIVSVNSATDFGGFPTIAAGTWIEVKGANLGGGSGSIWTGADFSDVNAPTNLKGITATVNGKAAFVYYISDTQVNVQPPADTFTGSVGVQLRTPSGNFTNLFNVQKAATVPGLLTPAAFNVGGKQYLVAQFTDNVFVGNPNLIAGATFRPAKPGDAVTVYGIGFGDVTPTINPGVVVTQQNKLVSSVSIRFDQTEANVTYSGLAPSLVGLYQFNFVVPNVPDGDYPINVTLGGQPLPQKPFLTVKH
jgi:uncharacterized protein (TIGR03437 family)